MMSIRNYTDLMKLKTFKERFLYLKLGGLVGNETFGFERYLNQVFYRSYRWKKVRDSIIIRDYGCDLGIEGREIYDKIIIHHMNPISSEDIEIESDLLLDPEFLISTSHLTHNAIHYGDEKFLFDGFTERFQNDTCPWRR